MSSVLRPDVRELPVGKVGSCGSGCEFAIGPAGARRRAREVPPRVAFAQLGRTLTSIEIGRGSLRVMPLKRLTILKTSDRWSDAFPAAATPGSESDCQFRGWARSEHSGMLDAHEAR